MQPFNVHPDLAAMWEAYPAARDIARACANGGNNARLAVARLWLSEGIPFAFRNMPALYENVRFWLASRLEVDPKEITVIGSARIGQSLAPKNLGTPFSAESDLDITTVSGKLFEKLVGDFNSWAADYETERVHPRNQRESGFWNDNLKRGPNIIGRGFMDSKLIPLLEPYRFARLVGETMYLLREKLSVTPNGPHVRGADVRAYRNWDAFAKQMAINLEYARPETPFKPVA